MKNYYVELTEKGKSHVATEELDDSNLGIDELIVKADVSMISAGTELSRAFAIKQGFKYPVRPGYSLVGTIVNKHPDNKEYEIGDRVFCGVPHALYSRVTPSKKTQGTIVIKVDKDINPKHATVLSLGQIALSGINLANVKTGDSVAVFGLGNIGIITCVLYQHMGCKVIGIDPVASRCKLANNMGIKNTYSGNDAVNEINKLTNNKGADICVDVTGASPAIINAINSCKKYGQAILLGSPRQSFECDITPVLNTIHMKNLKVIGAFNETAPLKAVEGSDNSLEKNMGIISDLIKSKVLDVDKMITHVVDPKDCEKAYYDLMYNKDTCSYVIFDWNNY